jgi:bifunctional non-homologous end joining protein LigD
VDLEPGAQKREDSPRMARKKQDAKLKAGEPTGEATRDFHPAAHGKKRAAKKPEAPAPDGTEATQIPRGVKEAWLQLSGHVVKITNPDKVFWPELGVTKGDLLQYYLDMAPWLVPHLRDRAMVMRRYPDGIKGQQFFMKRSPPGKPDWVETISIEHSSGNVIAFPMVQDAASLLWVVNLGCIDLNQWYARYDDVDRPDYVHFDLDPAPDVPFAQVLEGARIIRDALASIDMPLYAKTTGSRGMHLYVPIVRGPTQKQVWTFAKGMSVTLSAKHPGIFTAEHVVKKRPPRRVHVDYNQNAWGRTLASIYSVRPHPRACVSMPVTWDEVARGIALEDFRIDNARERVRERGDLWAPLLAPEGRVDLMKVSGGTL